MQWLTTEKELNRFSSEKMPRKLRSYVVIAEDYVSVMVATVV
jgi:hypothetical protein